MSREDNFKRMFDMVHRHKDFDRRLYETVRHQEYSLVKNCATKEAKSLYDMQRSVSYCFHKKTGFLRFKVSSRRIMYAKTTLEHDVSDLLLFHFHRRFPCFHIAIENDSRTHLIDPKGCVRGYEKNVEEVVALLETTLPEDELLKGMQMEPSLWEEYYDSQCIPERRNISLMNKLMPLKHRDENAIESRISKRCRSISEFI